MFDYDRHEERTGVQEAREWDARYDVQSDFVMIYGPDGVRRRAAVWKRHGYVLHLMTGVAWGGYQDYIYGSWDGKDHTDIGQMSADGPINHGERTPYIVPTVSFADYLIEKLKPAVDAGVEAIHLEEPEFWTRGGYSEAFKREWRLYYGEEWSDPAATCEAQYRASKLKQYLYTRTFDRLCSSLKEYALTRHKRLLRFYVPTHSLINYSQWMIVSPESMLLTVPSIDGYIAQIWTGTARTANYLRGVRAERTFMTAFLEYGIMEELTRGTSRRMWFLADPVEDRPTYTWDDYRKNYFCTVAASLMRPDVWRYEVAPWPSRVFAGSYPDGRGGREVMPEKYRTEVLSVMQTLRNMKQSEYGWRDSRPEVGLLLADSAMYQRIYPKGESRTADGEFSCFFGLALPPLEAGYAVSPVQLDNIARFAGYLSKYKVLVLSYEFMKPSSPAINYALAEWVRRGGKLVYVGDGSDPYHRIREWWNESGNDYADPSQHLFEALGAERGAKAGEYACGEGKLYYLAVCPDVLAKNGGEADKYVAAVAAAAAEAGMAAPRDGAFVLDRGPYTIAASNDGKEHTVKGCYIDLFEAGLPIVQDFTLGEDCRLMFDLKKIDRTKPAQIIAVAARPEKLKISQRKLSFRAIGPEGSVCSARIWLKRAPKSVKVGGKDASYDFDNSTMTLFLRFANSVDGVGVDIAF